MTGCTDDAETRINYFSALPSTATPVPLSFASRHVTATIPRPHKGAQAQACNKACNTRRAWDSYRYCRPIILELCLGVTISGPRESGPTSTLSNSLSLISFSPPTTTMPTNVCSTSRKPALFIMFFLKAIRRWSWTLFLFTKTDYKTIFFPIVSALACPILLDVRRLYPTNSPSLLVLLLLFIQCHISFTGWRGSGCTNFNAMFRISSRVGRRIQ